MQGGFQNQQTGLRQVERSPGTAVQAPRGPYAPGRGAAGNGQARGATQGGRGKGSKAAPNDGFVINENIPYAAFDQPGLHASLSRMRSPNAFAVAMFDAVPGRHVHARWGRGSHAPFVRAA
jgi:hypothetical protein